MTENAFEVSQRRGSGATSRSRPTLRDALRGHNNCFGLLRLGLASAVIVHHAYPLSGRAPNTPLFTWTSHQQDIGSLAVGGFFAISGYLITKSGMVANVGQFLWRRALRIFPAFWFLLLVSVFVVGPIFFKSLHGSLTGYFTLASGGSWAYFRDNFFLAIHQYGILDVFSNTPYGKAHGSVFNGSLWTLVYEWRCYLLVALLVATGLLARSRWSISVTWLLALVLQLSLSFDPRGLALVPPIVGDPFQVQLTYIFMTGALIAAWADAIRFEWLLGLSAWLIVGLTLWLGMYDVIGAPAFAFGLIWIAARLPRWLHWIGAKNDYSYGMYIYGFLVQQATASLGWYRWGIVSWTLACFGVTAACAWFSWHVVEQWPLRLKDRGPGARLSAPEASAVKL